MLLLKNCRLYDAAADAAPTDLLLRDGRIARVGGTEPTSGASVLDAGGRTVIPGLIDVHIHGSGGADVMDATPEALRTMAVALAARGTTGFLATTVMRLADGERHLVEAARLTGERTGGARILGLHVEGPFVNPERRGGIPPKAIYPTSRAALEEVLALTDGALRVMTIAPEMPGNLEVIERLAGEGIIASFGHSAASYEETRAGIAAGISQATHLFNAMPGLHHRAPGPLVALHEAEGVSVELISDGVHVDRHVVRFARALFGPERCICITDAMRTAGLPDGRYQYGGRDFESRDGTARYLDGTLIGTALGLLDVVRRYQDFTGCTFREAVESATLLPARRLGLDKGRLAPGYDADLVVLDTDGEVWATVVAGELVYERGNGLGNR